MTSLTNLNLIERFWKYLKKKVYCEHFVEFKKAVTNFLDNIIGKHRADLISLLLHNFKIMDTRNL